ncbi:hypothetical protein AMS68_002719 [Peltaster fructicola]|uniref:RING-CH-type domain-containing protein n=1 Tax=Peltaster fructicola TaxID=286661 RepID=A0A6H0XR05_9PEZI|nr:hypothetical protein AMS68_002719 [Peltaster fructicola]
MAAFTSGADWSFDGIPGGWQSPTQAETTQSETTQEPVFDAPQEPQQERKHWPPRQCRICLELVQPTFEMNDSPLPASLRPKPRVTYTSSEGGRLLRPCKCKGTQKYVHEDCLSAWRMADPLAKRNYWECPTCRYRYHLQRLTWAAYISSTSSQLGLTMLILLVTVFVLGFVADPIINLYLDPVYTVYSGGGPTGSLVFEDEAAGWTEHFVKGLASLGLLGFAKFLFTLSPLNVFNIRARGGGFGGARVAAGTGRDRLSQIGWIAILVGVVTFLWAVWKAVRAWSRRTLQAAGERVMDVPGSNDEDEDTQ